MIHLFRYLSQEIANFYIKINIIDMVKNYANTWSRNVMTGRYRTQIHIITKDLDPHFKIRTQKTAKMNIYCMKKNVFFAKTYSPDLYYEKNYLMLCASMETGWLRPLLARLFLAFSCTDINQLSTLCYGTGINMAGSELWISKMVESGSISRPSPDLNKKNMTPGQTFHKER